ncbi:unnamed protein product [Allacma fusca]|uniref:Uncharacterized protein n=1 Tax=Allacma fusca TaxID=39272 RepID=A0A8J2KY87_9HEXA|nr:unnamed protein product [Allacma fusca]
MFSKDQGITSTPKRNVLDFVSRVRSSLDFTKRIPTTDKQTGKRQQLNEGERTADTEENTSNEEQRQGSSESEGRNEVDSESDKSNDDNQGQISAPPDTGTTKCVVAFNTKRFRKTPGEAFLRDYRKCKFKSCPATFALTLRSHPSEKYKEIIFEVVLVKRSGKPHHDEQEMRKGVPRPHSTRCKRHQSSEGMDADFQVVDMWQYLLRFICKKV